MLKSHVDEIVVENGRATGIRLKSGSVIRWGVVCVISLQKSISHQHILSWLCPRPVVDLMR